MTEQLAQHVSRYAQIDSASKVLRVVVCTQPEWLASVLGETWVPAGDVTQPAGLGRYYLGPGDPVGFVDPWHPPADSDSGYAAGSIRWHNGQAWVSDIDGNLAEPGDKGWSEYKP